jgi:hypothetical protein
MKTPVGYRKLDRPLRVFANGGIIRPSLDEYHRGIKPAGSVESYDREAQDTIA